MNNNDFNELKGVVGRVMRMLSSATHAPGDEVFSDDWKLVFVPPGGNARQSYHTQITLGDIKLALRQQPLFKPFSTITLNNLSEQLSEFIEAYYDKRKLNWTGSVVSGRVMWDTADDETIRARIILEGDGRFFVPADSYESVIPPEYYKPYLEDDRLLFNSFKEAEEFLTNGFIFKRKLYEIIDNTIAELMNFGSQKPQVKSQEEHLAWLFIKAFGSISRNSRVNDDMAESYEHLEKYYRDTVEDYPQVL